MGADYMRGVSLSRPARAAPNRDESDMLELWRSGHRFFGGIGALVESSLNDRVLGISVAELRQVPRMVGIAGGVRKHEAIRAAAAVGWIDVLITDVETAEYPVRAD